MTAETDSSIADFNHRTAGGNGGNGGNGGKPLSRRLFLSSTAGATALGLAACGTGGPRTAPAVTPQARAGTAGGGTAAASAGEQLNCLEILRNGLPESTEQPRRQIVIVGAGIAGLTAGMLLKQAGHDVTILEAQNRLGGRILTYRGFPGKMYAEFGAMRFPRQHPLARYLIEERFKLATKPFPVSHENTIIFRNGKAVRRKDFRSQDYNYKLSEGEQGKTPDELLRGAVRPLIDIMDAGDHEAGWQRILAEYDSYSVLRYLKERGLSHGALSLIGPLLNLESRYYFSLVEWFSHYYENVFGDLVYIVDGADSLAKAFEPELLDSIRLGAQVHAIDQTAQRNRVLVHYRTAGGKQRIGCDECIITAPLGILRHMEIGGLDTDKWWAIRNSYYGMAHKIFMQFSDRWWESKYQIPYGTTVTDLAIRNVVYTPAGQDHRFKGGVIIASYCWEQDSIPYNPLSEEERITEALEDLSVIHPEAQRTFEFGISKNWSMDRYAGGIGPLFRPFEMSGELYENVVRPVDRIWFANDACDRRHRRWIEGALKAAVKNAYALHTGLRNEMPWKD